MARPKGNGPGVLYVMHPAGNLTAYFDDTGDGVADRQEDLITGLGFDLTFRGADHTTNGCRLAIDGFIYIAMGDYGCINAKGKDGTTLTHRGGGIVRIRPDGTGLELVVERQLQYLRCRRLAHARHLHARQHQRRRRLERPRQLPSARRAHGLPVLFQKLPRGHDRNHGRLRRRQPSCGSIWLDEPGLPKGLFTVEWGVGGIFYHDDLGAQRRRLQAHRCRVTTDPRSAYLRPHVPQKGRLLRSPAPPTST